MLKIEPAASNSVLEGSGAGLSFQDASPRKPVPHGYSIKKRSMYNLRVHTGPGPGDKGSPKSQMSYYQRPLLGIGSLQVGANLPGNGPYVVSSNH
jgi:hypothetical protein